jgi:hypothetical protein
VEAEWVDFSTRAGTVRVDGKDLASYYERLRSGSPIAPPMPTAASEQSRRFFGQGDVLRNAALEFGAESVVEIQSRFDNCTITLVEGALLTVGEDGVLEGCRIAGPGEIVVHGRIAQGNGSPSISGPKRLIVGKTGSVEGSIEQHPDLTQFAFERGCAMRLNIIRHR